MNVNEKRYLISAAYAVNRGIPMTHRFAIGSVVAVAGHLVPMLVTERVIDVTTEGNFPVYVLETESGNGEREFLADEWRIAPWTLADIKAARRGAK